MIGRTSNLSVLHTLSRNMLTTKASWATRMNSITTREQETATKATYQRREQREIYLRIH